jgi:hypothetical protein
MLDPDTAALLNQLGYDAGFIESLLSSAIWLTVVALVTAVPTGIIAERKGRSRTLWFLLALSIPLLPLLLVWLLPKLPEKTK